MINVFSFKIVLVVKAKKKKKKAVYLSLPDRLYFACRSKKVFLYFFFPKTLFFFFFFQLFRKSSPETGLEIWKQGETVKRWFAVHLIVFTWDGSMVLNTFNTIQLANLHAAHMGQVFTSRIWWSSLFNFTLWNCLGAQQGAKLEITSIKITGTGTNN